VARELVSAAIEFAFASRTLSISVALLRANKI